MWPTTNTTVSPLETTDTTDDDSLRLTTISTNKHEVANGFVKNGSSLPYVYETNDSGLSKSLILVISLSMPFSRKPKKILQNDSYLWNMRKEVCVCDYDEEALGDTHWRKALFLQSLWQTVYAEGKSQGKCQTYIIIKALLHCLCC